MSRCNFSTYQCILIQTTLILCILLLSIADKFGDISKKVVSSSTKGVEEVVKKVTKNEEYHFGDLTRGAVGATTSGVENVVRSVIKNEDCE